MRAHRGDLNERCGCGRDAAPGAQRFGCLECGFTCCAACAVTLESVAYCGHCATALLETVPRAGGEPLELL